MKQKLSEQIIKFLIVGGLATLFDILLLVILKEVLHVDVIVASAISFCASTILNYVLSMTYVFRGKDQSKVKEFLIFFVLSAFALLINQFVMWLGVEVLCFNYLFVKAAALVIVTCYNFVSRKLILEKK